MTELERQSIYKRIKKNPAAMNTRFDAYPRSQQRKKVIHAGDGDRHEFKVIRELEAVAPPKIKRHSVGRRANVQVWRG